MKKELTEEEEEAREKVLDDYTDDELLQHISDDAIGSYYDWYIRDPFDDENDEEDDEDNETPIIDKVRHDLMLNNLATKEMIIEELNKYI